MKTINFNLYLDGYELKSSVEIEESELSSKTLEEQEEYIYDCITCYVQGNLEILVEDTEE